MREQRTFKVPRTGRTYTFRTDQMAGKNFRGGDFSGSDLHELDLHDACFEWADLTGANLRGANLEGANLRAARLYKADLTDANLRGAQLWQAKFDYAHTRHTDFRRARNLACLTGTAYNASISLAQLRMAITDMNYHVWQRIWRLRRTSLWSLVALAMAAGARFARLLDPFWSRWTIAASVALLVLSLLSLAKAHYVRLRKTSCFHS